MSFKLIREATKIPDFGGRCPICYNKLYDLHDLRCDICNRTTIRWCPSCEEHFELDLEGTVNIE